jgi:hypothetical protein
MAMLIRTSFPSPSVAHGSGYMFISTFLEGSCCNKVDDYDDDEKGERVGRNINMKRI